MGHKSRITSALKRFSARTVRHPFWKNGSGNFSILFALSSPVLIGVAGLATEGGLWVYKHQTLQAAADGAALSAATRYGLNNTASLTTQANAIAATFGYPVGSMGTTVTISRPPTSGAYTANNKAIEVRITTSQPRLLSALYSSAPMTLAARAVALSASDGKGCVLALNGTASGSVTSQGTSDMILKGCSLYANSNNASAVVNGGSATMSVDSVNIVGGLSGGSGITTANGIHTNSTAADDPYATVNPPSFSGCNANASKIKTTVTLSPGVYCNGLTLNAGANVTLNPGIYYIDRGSLSVNGGATLTGTGVTIVLTSSNGANYADATINGGATVNLTAPTSGATEGIVIFGDRNMATGTAVKINGGAGQILGGAVYVPKGELSYAGGANTKTNCTQLIGDTVIFTGNSYLAIDCSAYDTKPIGTSLAKLVE